MGQRGPKPTPVELKIARGNPGKRPIPKDLPALESTGYGPPPSYFNKYAKAEWRRMVPLIEQAGLAPDVAKSAFETYCYEYGQVRDARDRIAEKGIIVRDGKTDRLIRNPAIMISNNSADRCLAFLVEFGLTPSSRTRVRADVVKAKEKELRAVDPWDKVKTG